jgi:hypothetical protein
MKIANARDPYDAPFIVGVEPRDDHTLTLTFEGGEKRSFGMKPYLDWPVFKPLRDLAVFYRVKIVYGSLERPGERDIAHDMLYRQSQPLPVESETSR